MGNFGDILPSQFVRVSELQRQTILAETELTQSLSDSSSPDEKDSESDVFVAPSDEQGLGEVFGKADDLRLSTLKNLVQILSPIQAVQFFIPAAQLHINVQKWGKNKEAAHTRRTHDGNSSSGSGSGSGTGSGSGKESSVGTQDFGGFFKTWLLEQERGMEELRSAAKAHTDQSQNGSTLILSGLVARVLRGYENYYQVKSESVEQNVFQMLTPTWRSILEHAFLWIGGWRPTTAFHLLYTVVGLQVEAGLTELLTEGLTTIMPTCCDLGDLSASQLTRVNELQMKTITEERELSEMLASMQETVADSSMVKLSRIATEIKREHDLSIRERVGPPVGTELVISKRVKLTLGPKENKLKQVLGKADVLRMKTIRDVVDVLNPIQAVRFLIAAAELHLRVHDWGKIKDAEL
ncbi:hypothetical protein SOVF_104720 [Spinacia oleracea]|nr:hypothetical protein SOVF_104720 [Spinacia oleracea]